MLSTYRGFRVILPIWLALLTVPYFAASAQARYYSVGKNQSIWVESRHYGAATLDPLVEFIASLPHGTEISRLSVYVAGPVELLNSCGSDADGCYEEEAEDWMVVPGEQLPEDESSVEEIVAHEYGHHLAANRPGGAFGTPRWDVYEHVCKLSQEGILLPGNEGRRVWENPEELFAESYAALTFPNLITFWEPWSTALQPTAGSLARILRDIEHPWPARYAEKGLHRSCHGGHDYYS